MPPTMTSGPPGLTLIAPSGPPLWRPRGQEDLAPSGAKAKANANLAALRVLRATQNGSRPPTADESAVLARWAGWGALPEIFDDVRTEWADQRAQLRALLSDAEWKAAALTTLNAHYTSAEVISAMWAAVVALGFTGGRVLEPGCGSGNFIGLAPDLPLDLVGVELDPITAAIAAALYPHADIRAQGFEDTNLAPDSFDLVVGNVPFAKLALHDPLHNRARHSVHNHFIIKALRFTRPGALMAVLTSRYTLDSRNPAARREMAELADLVGAVRLPNGAMQRAAGTQAIMDLLILRRREGAPNLFATPWASLSTVPCGGDTPTVTINEYFGAHRDHVLGTIETDQGMYGKDELVVRSAGDLSPALTTALADIVAAGLDAGLGWKAPLRPTVKAAGPSRPAKQVTAPKVATVPQHGRRIVIPPPPRKEGTVLTTDGDTGFGIVRYGSIEAFTPTPKGSVAEVTALVQLRDIVAALLEAQASSGDDSAFSDFQEALNQAYDDYVGRFGPISRFSTRPTGRIAHCCPLCVHEWILGAKDHAPTACPACGEPYTDEGTPRMARIMPPMGGFRAADPDFPALLALEIFDPETQTAHKAPIFTTRVVAPRSHAEAAETAQDALSMCLDQYGDVRLDRIAELLGVDVDEARQQLGDLVWEDPIGHMLVTAAAYLSGNIRTKLAEARLAALDDPRFNAHVAALEEVLPADLATTEIDARLGCTWIDADDVRNFLVEALGAPDDHTSVGHVALTATWNVGIPAWERTSVSLASTWGTTRCDAGHLVQFSLNQQPATVYDSYKDGSGKDVKVLNVEETMKAREKQEAVEECFSTWIWSDPDRAKRLARIYNDRFNSTVLPVFDGAHLSLPGLSADMVGRVHPHQLNSIWRGISSPTLGLFHPVGAGKTLVMCAMGMEMRRLGLIAKPVYVVPNHMLEQFTAEFIRHYPLARVLMATKEQTTAANRKEFVARCAMGDWDGIVITASAFERIPLSDETKAEFLDTKMAALEAAIREQEEQSGRASTKRMQLSLKKLVERHKRLLAEERKDNGVRFEATGIDYIFYDEAHYAKNMSFPSHIQGVGGDGSQRAEDLEAKVTWLRTQHGERVVCLATATPVANTLAEIFVMQRYLQPDALHEAKIYEFDAWAATFGRTINQIELSPDGSSYRIASRFARFRNVPDLMAMFWQVSDILTPESLGLPIPAIAGGEAEVVKVAATDALRAYMADVAQRAQDIRDKKPRRLDDPDAYDDDEERKPKLDNMLVVSTDGRKAALHLSLVRDPETKEPLVPDGPDKIVAAAQRIAAIYRTHRHTRFKDSAGNVADRPGGFQLVFCDLGTPKDGQWSVYGELRGALVAAGVPESGIRYIHEAKDDRAKADLFGACRDGRISVLIASTAKGGVGTNVQSRMVALHHIDCPWRPCDIEQREGRILRQGNQNAVVNVVRYVTESSFDIYLWQTVTRKAAFIYQVMSGKFKGREVDDIGEQALSYAEVTAIATGNPLLLEQAGVNNEVARLTRSRRAHHQDQSHLEWIIDHGTESLDTQERIVAMCEAAIARRLDTRGEKFAMTLHGRRHTVRQEAGEALVMAMLQGANGIIPGPKEDPKREVVGSLGGFDIALSWQRKRTWEYTMAVFISLRLVGTDVFFQFTRADVMKGNPHSLIIQLENNLADLERTRNRALVSIDQVRSELEQAQARLGIPFPHEEELATLERRAKEIATTLQRQAEEAEAARNRARTEGAAA